MAKRAYERRLAEAGSLPSTNWQERANCIDEESELFFPPIGAEDPEQREAREQAAKAICGGCVVINECLEWAVERDERLGIWGGMTESERAGLARPR